MASRVWQGHAKEDVDRLKNLRKQFSGMKKPPTDVKGILKATPSGERYIVREQIRDAKAADKDPEAQGWEKTKTVMKDLISGTKKDFAEYKKLESQGEKKVQELGSRKDSRKANKELSDAHRYVKSHGNLKKGSKQARELLDDGDSSQRKLWRGHRQDLKAAQETIAKSKQGSGQTKTGRVPKGLKGIADKMKGDGKSGWVTINGTAINLG